VKRRKEDRKRQKERKKTCAGTGGRVRWSEKGKKEVGLE